MSQILVLRKKIPRTTVLRSSEDGPFVESLPSSGEKGRNVIDELLLKEILESELKRCTEMDLWLSFLLKWSSFLFMFPWR